MSFSRKFGDKYGRNLMDTAIKTRIDASKIVVQKTAEATRDFFGVK